MPLHPSVLGSPLLYTRITQWEQLLNKSIICSSVHEILLGFQVGLQKEGQTFFGISWNKKVLAHRALKGHYWRIKCVIHSYSMLITQKCN